MTMITWKHQELMPERVEKTGRSENEIQNNRHAGRGRETPERGRTPHDNKVKFLFSPVCKVFHTHTVKGKCNFCSSFMKEMMLIMTATE